MKDYPKLEWKNDDVAEIQKWFGETAKYSVYQTVLNGIGFGSTSTGTEVVGYEEGFETFDKAKEAAQAHFEQRLQQPMSFGQAMAAVARGCEARRKSWDEGVHVKIDGMWAVIIDKHGNSEGAMACGLENITATDWRFYFPERKKPQKRRPLVVLFERWKCPVCDATYDHEHLNAPGEMECDGCDTMLRRPEKAVRSQ